MIVKSEETVDQILFKDVDHETDNKVLAERYDLWAKKHIEDEGLQYQVYPDGMIYYPNWEFRMLQSYVRQDHETVLDVGCGRGLGLAYWATKGFKTIWGCDISQNMIDACQEMGFVCRKVDLNQPHLLLPYLPNGFDIVTCTHVLEHVKDPAMVVKELYRVTKDLVMITVPVGRSYWSESHINVWKDAEELVAGLGIEEHWICSLEQVISKPADLGAGYSCFILVIYKALSEE